MPAPDLKPQVPGETATPPEDPIVLLSKGTIPSIVEALQGLTGGDLVALYDLETAAANPRKGVFEAIEAEDARRAALADAAADAAADAEDNAAAILVPDYVTAEDANRLYGDEYGVDWVYEGGAYVPATAPAAADLSITATAKPVAAGQAVLTDAGWVVPEPQPKG